MKKIKNPESHPKEAMIFLETKAARCIDGLEKCLKTFPRFFGLEKLMN